MRRFLQMSLASTALTLLVGISLASAHVTVKPAEVGVATFQTFDVSLPVEKDTPTVSLRLVIPDGLNYVTPTVKPGWKIDVKKEGTGDSAKATEINWTGGSVPAGQRDDFTFSAQAPAKATSLHWKAYQIYQDGSVVSWDQEPKGGDDDMGDKGPYSTTMVKNDLTGNTNSNTSSNLSLLLSAVAIAVSFFAVSGKIKK